LFKKLKLAVFCSLFSFWSISLAQELSTLKSEIPFSLRMCFFKGPADSTRSLLTVSVDNKNLLFYRGGNYFEAHYEVFLSMRETKSHYHVRGDWDKILRVPSYDETILASYFDPLKRELNLLPGKYEGFIEVKDMQAMTYGNGRLSVSVPDFSKDLPKLSTPLFYEPGETTDNPSPPIPGPNDPIPTASLKYPAGKPIFLLIEVYSDSTVPPDGWTLTAEVVKELRVFPRIEEPLSDGIYVQRKLLKIPTKTMGLGTYQIEVSLRDKTNTILARASSFDFRIIKSALWVDQNYENEVRYLKYLATKKEMKKLLETPEHERAAALKAYWDKLDPVPATPINELKIQYFERIDYANKHFTTEDREGWETNMGEVYIMLGPPTEIYGSRLNQIWVYEVENLVLYFFNYNLRNREVFDEYVRLRRRRD